ncbi:MAG TPA: Mth938-like domain-containing protein [Alphaproteobacteria bacterium]|nr:Mth938-like domain-containing protein [Alphaproteobacteria bacterium]
MDVTPLIPEGRQMVQGYGDGRFRVTEVVWEGSILVFAGRTEAWPVTDPSQITLEALRPVVAMTATVDLLLLGTGRRMALISAALKRAMKEQGIVVETMDTGAAARTYNVLMAEERRVAAALIAV